MAGKFQQSGLRNRGKNAKTWGTMNTVNTYYFEHMLSIPFSWNNTSINKQTEILGAFTQTQLKTHITPTLFILIYSTIYSIASYSDKTWRQMLNYTSTASLCYQGET
jgi:hypothetical protein